MFGTLLYSDYLSVMSQFPITYGIPQHAMQIHHAHIRPKLENSLVFPVCSKCNLKTDLVFQFCKLLTLKNSNFRGSNHFLSVNMMLKYIQIYGINTDKLYLEYRNHIFRKILKEYLPMTYQSIPICLTCITQSPRKLP